MITLSEVFAGDRARLLRGPLAAEFGTAVQVTAASTVLPGVVALGVLTVVVIGGVASVEFAATATAALVHDRRART